MSWSSVLAPEKRSVPAAISGLRAIGPMSTDGKITGTVRASRIVWKPTRPTLKALEPNTLLSCSTVELVSLAMV